MNFYLRVAWFNVREQFSSFSQALGIIFIYPFFMWLLTRVWERYNGSMKTFTAAEVTLYIGMTELLFMSFLGHKSVGRAAADFSFALARPRPWLVVAFAGIFGRTLGMRFLFFGFLFLYLPFFGIAWDDGFAAMGRLALILLPLTLVHALVPLFFSSAQVYWEQTEYLILPVSKIFLVFGGVFGPLIDYSEPWKSWLLVLPPSDLFFQPAYYCLRGEFSGITLQQWIFRVSAQALCLILLNRWFFKFAKKNHQSYGG